MNDLPDFNEPAAPTEPPKPRKPGPKPTRRKKRKVRKAAALPVPKKRRKRRVSKHAVVAAQHHGGRYPPHVYNLIGRLMNLETPLRNFVMEVTKALGNERP